MVTAFEILDLVPECKGLPDIDRNALFQLIEIKLQKLTFKLTTSQYAPRERDDVLNLNHNPTRAVKDWLEQFSPQHRLAALACVLNLSYVTEREVNQFLDVVFAQFVEHVEEEERL